MNKTRFCFFFTFVITLVCFTSLFSSYKSDKDKNCFSQETTPSWVKPLSFSLNESEVSTKSGIEYLLIDYQNNWKEKVNYRHFAKQVVSQSAIEQVSKIQIIFDPSHQKVQVHDIKVNRDGKWTDRLKLSQPKLLQREKELEGNIYDGNLTLLYFLDDIRKGDIIEFSYSILGHHPILESHFSDRFYLEGPSSIGKIAYRLLISPQNSISIKTFNTDITPSLTKLSKDTHEYIWKATNTKNLAYEPNIPNWYDPFGYIQMSEYNNWEEVVREVAPLFQLPPNFEEELSEDLKTLVEKWKNRASSPEEQALQALRFVQEEVRYLGFENGLGAYKPKNPNTTFQQRFGDCKDKTFLLHGILKLLGIHSTPLLVHTSKGKNLTEALPSPTLFNHAVLIIMIDSSTYWVDPTISNQGGTLKACFFPNYWWGLELSESSSLLSCLPETENKPTQIDTLYDVVSEDFVNLKLTSTFYGFEADRVRRSVESRGIEKMSKSMFSNIQRIYGTASSESPLDVVDDRENNILQLFESYTIPTWVHKSNKWKMIDVLSHTLRNYLHSSLNPEREFPFSLCYPMWVKEHIRISSPFYNWAPHDETYTKEHKSLYYKKTVRSNGRLTDYYLELKHLQNHVPIHSLQDYWDVVNDIDKEGPYRASIMPLKNFNHPNFLPPVRKTGLIGLLIFPCLYFLSKRKRITQDNLRFYLNRFQKFYFCFIPIFLKFFLIKGLLPITITLILVGGLFHFLFRKLSYNRSYQMLSWLQIGICSQIFSSLILVLNNKDLLVLDRSLIAVICLLYLGYGLNMLEKARTYLIKEKIVEHE